MGPDCAPPALPLESVWRGPGSQSPAGRRGSQGLYELRLSPSRAGRPNGVVWGQGAGNTWRQSQTPASTCLPPPRIPLPTTTFLWQKTPEWLPSGPHVPHRVSGSYFPLFLLHHPTHQPSPEPCRALQGAGHAAAPQEGFCPLRSPEMPGAPSGAKEKPSPASLRPGWASGSSQPATSKPARHQNVGSPGTHTDAQASLGP